MHRNAPLITPLSSVIDRAVKELERHPRCLLKVKTPAAAETTITLETRGFRAQSAVSTLGWAFGIRHVGVPLSRAPSPESRVPSMFSQNASCWLCSLSYKSHRCEPGSSSGSTQMGSIGLLTFLHVSRNAHKLHPPILLPFWCILASRWGEPTLLPGVVSNYFRKTVESGVVTRYSGGWKQARYL